MAAGRFSCFGKDGLIVPAVAMGVQKDGTSAGGGWFIFVIRVFCIDGGGVAPGGCCQELGLTCDVLQPGGASDAGMALKPLKKVVIH